MRELPMKTRGVVGARLSQGEQPLQTKSSREGNTDVSRVRPRLLRFPAVRERTGLSRSTIWRLERRGEFPKHHRISANVVAWVEEDVHQWIEARVG